MLRLKPGQVTLERALSKLGIASRTEARDWIRAGRVKVNGTLRTDPRFAVVPERAKIEIDGEKKGQAALRTILLHKPRGTVTTRRDEKGRPTVFDSLGSHAAHLIAVGRLDWATSGLLILTNDTRLADWLTDPAHCVPRTYVVTVRGQVTDEELSRLREGIRDEGEWLKPDALELRKASGKESHLTVTLTEGRNREIRRLFSAVGHEVTRLKRVAYGGLDLGKLEPGEFRELSNEELLAAFPGAPLRAAGVIS